MKRALITGITGQDGLYLTELLLSKGYEVHGLSRMSGTNNELLGIEGCDSVILHQGDICNYESVLTLIEDVDPDEIYHLAAQSRVASSFEDNFQTFRVNTDSTHYFLSALRRLNHKSKFYFAASSEMFGRVTSSPQNEETPFNPVSPYGISKVAGFQLVKMHREAFGMFVCSGILFNHESIRRPKDFVVRKITSTVAKIKLGLVDSLELGNIDVRRDWGFAGDYVEVMWMMLNRDRAEDIVIGTGESHSLRDVLDVAFKTVDLNWGDYVKINKDFFRPIEVNEVLADSSKAKQILRWSPKVGFNELVQTMVTNDLEYYKKNG